jgi:hypothetical protein
MDEATVQESAHAVRDLNHRRMAAMADPSGSRAPRIR